MSALTNRSYSRRALRSIPSAELSPKLFIAWDSVARIRPILILPIRSDAAWVDRAVGSRICDSPTRRAAISDNSAFRRECRIKRRADRTARRRLSEGAAGGFCRNAESSGDHWLIASFIDRSLLTARAARPANDVVQCTSTGKTRSTGAKRLVKPGRVRDPGSTRLQCSRSTDKTVGRQEENERIAKAFPRPVVLCRNGLCMRAHNRLDRNC